VVVALEGEQTSLKLLPPPASIGDHAEIEAATTMLIEART
jgi:hypothetical protein